MNGARRMRASPQGFSLEDASQIRGPSLDHANQDGAHGLTPTVFPRGLFETSASQERDPIICLMLKKLFDRLA